MEQKASDGGSLSRRDFLGVSAAATAGAILSGSALGGDAGAASREVPVGFIGVGSEGRLLLMDSLKIPGIRFVAICDIWPYHQRYAKNILKKYKQTPNVYEDYREMLAKEKGLEAVIIATPDWVHAEQTVACLKAGLHVYCEKEMSNTIEGCRQMVQAARETKKLLQIGHQRRSNPRYHLGLKMVQQDKLLGRVTHVYGQWNRAKRLDLGWPQGEELDQAVLDKYGYGTMERFRNWRWYRKYSGGAMADLGSHQVDIFNWFLKTPPKSVLAGGGLDYYKDREWYDNVMAIYEYQTAEGTVRGFYQVLNTTSFGGFYEVFMGDQGSLQISEDIRKGFFFREVEAKRQAWEDEAKKIETMGMEAVQLKVGESLAPDGSKDPKAQELAAEAQKPVHQLHLENFFNAVRLGTPLSCPSEVAFETAVSVLKANDAVAAGRKIEFQPSDFKA